MDETTIALTGHAIDSESAAHRGHEVTLETTLGEVPALLRCPAEPDAVVVWCGGWRGPEGERRPSPISDAVSADLLEQGIASLMLGYRRNAALGSCVQDVRMALAFLEETGFQRIALVGHSFSGAVVISSAPTSQAVVAVVGLASQTFGAQTVAHVHPRPILLVHGTADQRLGPHCSEQIYSWAKKPKELVLLEGASHGLQERYDALLPLLGSWLADKLQP